MARFRFSIRSLLVLIMFAAVGIAALRQASPFWDSATCTLALGLFITAPLWAIHRSGRRRAFWVGFALCGWAYIVASLVPAVEPRLLTTHAFAFLDAKRQALLQATGGAAFADFDSDGTLDLVLANGQGQPAIYQTVEPILSAYKDVTASVGLSTSKPEQNAISVLYSSPKWPWTRLWLVPAGSSESFVHIGHALFAVMLAYLGGRMAGRLYRQRHPELS